MSMYYTPPLLPPDPIPETQSYLQMEMNIISYLII